MFNALLATKDDDQHRVAVAQIDKAALADAGVLIKVDYSTINYKDALAVTATAPIIRNILWCLVSISQGPLRRAMTPIGKWVTVWLLTAGVWVKVIQADWRNTLVYPRVFW